MKLLWTVLFLLIFSTTANAEKHLWMPGDQARATAICVNEIALTKTAEKFQENTKQAAYEAEKIWWEAVQNGECIIAPKDDRWKVTLIEKLSTFENMFGREGMNGELWKVIMINLDGKEFEDKYGYPVPLGVMGRNSDNNLFGRKVGWKPSQSLFVGMKKTYEWIKYQLEGVK